MKALRFSPVRSVDACGGKLNPAVSRTLKLLYAHTSFSHVPAPMASLQPQVSLLSIPVEAIKKPFLPTSHPCQQTQRGTQDICHHSLGTPCETHGRADSTAFHFQLVRHEQLLGNSNARSTRHAESNCGCRMNLQMQESVPKKARA